MDYVENCQRDGRDTVYVDFLNEYPVYEEVKNLDDLRTYMLEKLEKYNDQPRVVPMDLVLF